MDDEIEFEATPEDIEEIINWAVKAAAVAHIIACTEDPENPDELREQFENARDALAMLHEDMPDSIFDYAIEMAHDSMETGAAIEDEVSKFREELKDFKGIVDE